MKNKEKQLNVDTIGVQEELTQEEELKIKNFFKKRKLAKQKERKRMNSRLSQRSKKMS